MIPNRKDIQVTVPTGYWIRQLSTGTCVKTITTNRTEFPYKVLAEVRISTVTMDYKVAFYFFVRFNNKLRATTTPSDDAANWMEFDTPEDMVSTMLTKYKLIGR